MDLFSFAFGAVTAIAIVAIALFIFAIGQYNKRSK